MNGMEIVKATGKVRVSWLDAPLIDPWVRRNAL